MLAPLTALTSKSLEKFIWTDEHQTSFEAIKKVMSQETLLAFPDFNKEFHLHTDASDYGIGGYLFQIIDGSERPNAFIS